MAFDSFHGGSRGRHITVIVEFVAAASNAGAVDFLLFRADGNSVAVISHFLVARDRIAGDLVQHINTFNIIGGKSLKQVAKFIFTRNHPANGDIRVVMFEDVAVIRHFVQFVIPNSAGSLGVMKKGCSFGAVVVTFDRIRIGLDGDEDDGVIVGAPSTGSSGCWC